VAVHALALVVRVHPEPELGVFAWRRGDDKGVRWDVRMPFVKTNVDRLDVAVKAADFRLDPSHNPPFGSPLQLLHELVCQCEDELFIQLPSFGFRSSSSVVLMIAAIA
jgi:hypothetical protein